MHRTMEIHYDKHHRAYYTNFMAAIKGTPLEGKPLSEIFANMSKQTDAVRNNGGGYYNHLLFWKNLKKGSPGHQLNCRLLLSKAFGSVGEIQRNIQYCCQNKVWKRMGMVVSWGHKNLAVASSPNQDNTLMDLSPSKALHF